MPTATKSPLQIFANLTLRELQVRQKRFNDNPNGSNWTACLEAMMTHQQLGYAMRSPSIDPEKLAFDLKQDSDWHNIVCRATLGMTCADALNQA